MNLSEQIQKMEELIAKFESEDIYTDLMDTISSLEEALDEAKDEIIDYEAFIKKLKENLRYM